jgi:hypothetical protein
MPCGSATPVANYQNLPRPAGAVYASAGRLGLMARHGYVAAALSQPDFGSSSGPPDFCGFTQRAALFTPISCAGEPS